MAEVESAGGAALPQAGEVSLVRPLVVFDFDWSLINENSDTWVIQQSRPELDLMAHMRDLHEKDPACKASWTLLMDRMMQKLHDVGVTRAELEACLRGVPYFAEMLEVVRWSHSQGCELAIVSDANEVFIRTILSHHSLSDAFSEVHTNPAEYAEAGAGALQVRPYVPVDQPHGCERCPTNMCKGSIVQRLLAARSPATPVIYIGDGSGDFCAALALREADWICAREGFSLLKKLRSPAGQAGLRASVLVWKDGCDVLRFFQRCVQPQERG